MQSILERFEQAKRKGNETLGKTAGAQDEQSAFVGPVARVEFFKALDERWAETRLTRKKENAARLALQPAEQKKRTAEEVTEW